MKKSETLRGEVTRQGSKGSEQKKRNMARVQYASYNITLLLFTMQILLSLPNFPFFVPEPDREQNQGVISAHQTHSYLLFDGVIAQKKLAFTFQQLPLIHLQLRSSFFYVLRQFLECICYKSFFFLNVCLMGKGGILHQKPRDLVLRISY